eukprot:CAMPEP_0185574012 /NCGR_PEP_ID=MMETSP0434-20130131/5568_1 /TAXON_ID=626734 ORGANISM="Favella taraikaensis, Strain Fe Narragansett Bay" /NCGR_SAMPLE_ID=MMETSP0434 /ASSEMBLY_ACC=CAM_ASM_000379 /LENGTH=132 /DNA_ID=CAMNT_0028190431 /DNA_START=822 /DNA_END=1220 /DNA_ORIENTATION=+
MQQQVASDGAAAQSNGSPEQQNMVEQEELQQQHMAQDINGLQQQDDAEYGDEMGGTGQVQVSNALAEQRASKKRAQDDVKLLANRIALLKLEEKKAWKKIEETKKKAIEIMKVRQRNAETRDEKEAFAAQRA